MSQLSVQAAAPARATIIPRQVWAFCVISLIWGLTWIPAKVGVEWIPATLFAAARGLAAGPVLLVWQRLRGGSLRIARGDWIPIFVVGFLSFAVTYALLFWGVGQVDSGLAAVVHFSLAPAFLLLIGTALGEEKIGRRKLVATLVGMTGLVVLNASEMGSPSGPRALLGIAAIVVATFAYALGIVRSRRLLRRYSPIAIAGWVQLTGALCLVAYSAVTQPASFSTLRHLAEPTVLASWGFLVVLGSIVAFSMYLRLTHEWSPHKAGMYAFVSPAIAVVAGAVVLHERMSPAELAGMGLMMTGTIIALTKPRS